MVKKIFRQSGLFILLASPAYSLYAAENTSDSTQTIAFEKNTWGIGLGAIFSPQPYKDTTPTILPIPIITYRSNTLNISGPFASYKFLNYKFAQTSAQVFLYPQVFKADDSSDNAISKLDNRNYLVMAGINQKFLSPYGIVNIGINADITTQSNGYMIDLGYNKPFIFSNNKYLGDSNQLVINPGIGVQYSNHLLTNYYYGISSTESQQSGLEVYHPSGAFSPYASLMVYYTIQKHWNISAIARVNRLANSIVDSPMVDKHYITTAIISLTYGF
jgi:outer membrane protein